MDDEEIDINQPLDYDIENINRPQTEKQNFSKLIEEKIKKVKHQVLRTKLKGMIDAVYTIKDMKMIERNERDLIYVKKLFPEMTKPYNKENDLTLYMEEFIQPVKKLDILFRREILWYQNIIIEMINVISGSTEFDQMQSDDEDYSMPEMSNEQISIQQDTRKSYSAETIRQFSKVLNEYLKSRASFERTMNYEDAREVRICIDTIRALYYQSDDDRIPMLFEKYTGDQFFEEVKT